MRSRRHSLEPSDNLHTETYDPDVAAVMLFADMTLWQAARYMNDGETYFTASQPVLMARFGGITLDNYWNLTVSDHRRFVAVLEGVAALEAADGG